MKQREGWHERWAAGSRQQQGGLMGGRPQQRHSPAREHPAAPARPTPAPPPLHPLPPCGRPAAAPSRQPCPAPPHLRVVRVRVEHDDRVGQHVGHVGRLERLGVAAQVPLRKLLHQAVDLLRLARQAEARQEGAAGGGRAGWEGGGPGVRGGRKGALRDSREPSMPACGSAHHQPRPSACCWAACRRPGAAAHRMAASKSRAAKSRAST